MTHHSLWGLLLLITLLCQLLSGRYAQREPIQYGHSPVHVKSIGILDPLAIFPLEIIQPEHFSGSQGRGPKPQGVRKSGRRGGVGQTEEARLPPDPLAYHHPCHC